MNQLRISLLGGCAVALGDPPREARLTSSVELMLAYLVLNRDNFHPRAQLVGLFWPDADEARARNCLNTTLWRLRRVLAPASGNRAPILLTGPRGDVAFNPDPTLWLDVAEFLDCAHAGLRAAGSPEAGQDGIARLEEAVRLYRGELLPGHYDDWVLRERERLHEVRRQCLLHLMGRHQTRGDYGAAIDFGRELLEDDPLREDVHRALMRLYAADGRRAHAVQQFHRCAALLAEELNIPPMPETRLLYERILRGDAVDPAAFAPVADPAAPRLREILIRLDHSITAFAEACRHAQTAIRETLDTLE